MSYNREYRTRITDSDSLMEALKQMGFHPEYHQAAVHLYGYHGDKRKETAEVVIPRKQAGAASNDIGFKQQADGAFLAIISDFDKAVYNNTWLNDVTGRALEFKALKSIKALGLKQVNRIEVSATHVRYQFQKG